MQGSGVLVNGSPYLASADSLTGYIFRLLSGSYKEAASWTPQFTCFELSVKTPPRALAFLSFSLVAAKRSLLV